MASKSLCIVAFFAIPFACIGGFWRAAREDRKITREQRKAQKDQRKKKTVSEKVVDAPAGISANGVAVSDLALQGAANPDAAVSNDDKDDHHKHHGNHQ